MEWQDTLLGVINKERNDVGVVKRKCKRRKRRKRKKEKREGTWVEWKNALGVINKEEEDVEMTIG